eukprot:gb/GEZN01002578.1/.p1 GENE.gb/GEZN01002578.1/~~gb/GEZN01002578.1/.p1  ORF type:complete len:644 (-),score=117.61 gb/GEZN01002578.1/:464-2395(-)
MGGADNISLGEWVNLASSVFLFLTSIVTGYNLFRHISHHPQYRLTPYYTRVILLPILDCLIVVLALMNPDYYEWFLPVKTLVEGLCINHCLYLLVEIAGYTGGDEPENRLREAGAAIESGLESPTYAFAQSSNGLLGQLDISVPPPDPFGQVQGEGKNGAKVANASLSSDLSMSRNMSSDLSMSRNTSGLSLWRDALLDPFQQEHSIGQSRKRALVSCCCFHYRSGVRFLSVKLILIKQFMVMAPLIALVAALSLHFFRDEPALLMLEPACQICTLIVSIIAMMSLNNLGRRLRPSVRGLPILAKTLSLQCIIVFGAVQNALVNLAVSKGAIDGNSEYSTAERAARIKAFAQCVETFAFSLFFLFAFSTKDYRSSRISKQEHNPNWVGMFNVFSLSLSDDRVVWRKALGLRDEGIWLLDDTSFNLPVPASGPSGLWGRDSFDGFDGWEDGDGRSVSNDVKGKRAMEQKQRVPLGGSLSQYPSMLDTEANVEGFEELGDAEEFKSLTEPNERGQQAARDGSQAELSQSGANYVTLLSPEEETQKNKWGFRSQSAGGDSGAGALTMGDLVAKRQSAAAAEHSELSLSFGRGLTHLSNSFVSKPPDELGNVALEDRPRSSDSSLMSSAAALAQQQQLTSDTLIMLD